MVLGPLRALRSPDPLHPADTIGEYVFASRLRGGMNDTLIALRTHMCGLMRACTEQHQPMPDVWHSSFASWASRSIPEAMARSWVHAFATKRGAVQPTSEQRTKSRIPVATPLVWGNPRALGQHQNGATPKPLGQPQSPGATSKP